MASYRAGTKYSLLYCYICVYHSIHDMKTEKVKITQVAVNAANPRLITEEKFHKLVISLLVFPKMLEYRPVVVDDKLTALGGNMRVKALQHINEMSLGEITQTFGTNKDFQAKTEAEQDQIIAFWQAWKQQPTIPIIKASTLSEAEQKEFIIKDNVSFGRWDWDMLANEWDTSELEDWGMDVWEFADENENNRSENVGELKDLSDKIVSEFKIEVDCLNEQTQEELFNELNERGLKCRILTL